MHNFSAVPVFKFECQCGYEFVADGNDHDEIRRQIGEHRQAVVFETGNSYKQIHGEELIETTKSNREVVVNDDEDYISDDERDQCWQCGGEGYLVAGEDIDLDDPVNNCDWSMGVGAGEVGKCPCCKGSGLAKDCMYF